MNENAGEKKEKRWRISPLAFGGNLEGKESKMFFRNSEQYSEDKDELPRTILF